MARRPIEFLYAGLRVRSLPRSLRFYSKLGFRVRRRGTMEHGGEWVHLRFPGASQWLELNFYPPGTRYYEPFRKGTEFDHLGFRVASLKAWRRQLDRLRIRAVATVRETRENLLYIEDPDGNWIEFIGPVEPKEPADRGRARRGE